MGSLVEKFPLWDEAIKWHIRSIWGDEEEDEKLGMKGLKSLHQSLQEILNAFVQRGSMKEPWDFPLKALSLPFGLEVILPGRKIGAQFVFGVYMKELFLKSSLTNIDSVPYMDDSFYGLFLELGSLGKFEFEDNARPMSSEGTRIERSFKCKRSSIAKLIRNFIALSAERENLIDIGDLAISWPLGTPWIDLIERGTAAFSKMYQVQYLLYRSLYQRSHSRTCKVLF